MNGYDPIRFARDEVALTGFVQPGVAPVVMFQHGLCGDAAQSAEAFAQIPGFRHAVMTCRGHGDRHLGPQDQLSIATFTDDLAAMIAKLGSPPIAVGGISMGAAMAMRLAVRCANLVPALIMVRPAWGAQAAPANMQPNAVVGDLLAAGQSVADFDQTATARDLRRSSPDNLASLRGFFDRMPRAGTAALLSRIAADGPGVTEADLAALRMPVLILGCRRDAIHPLALAQQLAALIPAAVFVEVPPKGQDRAAHIAALQDAVAHFLKGLI